MHTVKKAALASALFIGLGSSHGEAAAQFSNMYFLGDSSADAGFYGARFTVNPGLVWAQDLGNAYGLSITPSNQGGTDYAQGGMRVSDLSPLVPGPTAPQRPLTVQIDELLRANARLDPNALYSVSIGYNDLFVNIAAAAAGQLTASQVQANITQAALQTVQQLARLSAAGARYILVLNLYDTGRSPFGLANPTAPLSALTGLFNSTLNAAIGQLGLQVIQINTEGLFTEMIANPSQFGFTNITSPACTTASSLTCTPNTLVAPNAAQSYLFADSVHPTPVGYAAMAQVVASVLQAPQEIGLLAEAPLQVEQANFRALDGRMMSALAAPRAQNKYEAYAIYDYGNYDRSNDFGGGDSQTNSVVLGGDTKLSDRLLAGIAFGYTEDKSSLGNSGGGFKLNEATLTAYVGYGSGPWYVGGSLGGGDLDFRDIHRTFPLGVGTRTETGSTRGTHLMARVLGGYWFSYGSWMHGPFARLTYQETKVYAWSETGLSSTAMSFGQQKRDSFVSSLGWQADGNLGWGRPWARVSWEKDYNNDARTVGAGLVSLPGTFALPAFKPDDSYILFNLGLSGELGSSKVTGFVSVNATASKNDGNYQAITVGIRAPL